MMEKETLTYEEIRTQHPDYPVEIVIRGLNKTLREHELDPLCPVSRFEIADEQAYNIAHRRNKSNVSFAEKYRDPNARVLLISLSCNDATVNEWLSSGGIILYIKDRSKPGNELYNTYDDGEIEELYASRDMSYADMAKDEFLKHACESALTEAGYSAEYIPKTLEGWK